MKLGSKLYYTLSLVEVTAMRASISSPISETPVLPDYPPAPARPQIQEIGTIYLLHFSSRVSDGHTTQHYMGWARDLKGRVRHHKNGTGARLTQVAVERGISMEVVRTWEGTRDDERRLKNGKRGTRLCPVCSGRTA